MSAAVTLADVAHIAAKLKMYPYFDVANYILMCSMVREDSSPHGSESQTFSRKHPLSCWISSMLMCFASVMLANAFVGDSPIAPFINHVDLLTATAVWYVINYSPFDIVYKICKFLPIHVLIYCLKEVQRVHKIHHGVSHAFKVYHHSYVIIVAVGVLKGAGYYYMRTFERLVRGNWSPAANEFLKPSLATKVSLLASVAFILDHEGLIHLPHHLLNLAVIGAFILLRLVYLLFHIHNPFFVLENLFCAIFLGGFVDALKQAVSPSKDKAKQDDNAAGGKGHAGKPKEE